MSWRDTFEQQARDIGCPVEWCGGRREQHGGDGSDPARWFHEDATTTPLPYGARAWRYQQGSGPILWSLILDAESFADGTIDEHATRLRAIATAVEQLPRG